MPSSPDTASFAIELADKMSGPARQAAQSAESLGQKIDEDTRALREMQKAMRRLKGGTVTNSQTFAKLRDQIDAQKASIAASQQRYLELGGSFSKVKRGTEQVTKATGNAEGRFGSLIQRLAGGERPIGMLSQGFRAAAPAMAVAAGAALGAASAIAAVTAAAAAATISITRYAVSLADASRAERLQFEGLNTLDRQWRRYTVGAGQMQRAIDRAAESSNVGRQALAGYARQLARAGLRGRAYQQALEVAGITAQVQGERGARQFLAMARSAQYTGASVEALADSYRRRLGPIARRQMLGLDNQSARFQERISHIFDGLKIEPLLEGMESLSELFSQNTVTGRALKQLAETVLQPIIDDAVRAIPMVKRFFQLQVIGFQRGVIWALRTRNHFLDFYDAIRDGMSRLRGFFSGESLGETLTEGITNGLRGGAARAVSAVGSLADSIASTFRDRLGIRSPSRVFAGFGHNISAGVVRGLDPRGVASAVGSMADQAAGAFAGSLGTMSPALSAEVAGELAGAPAGGALGGSVSVSIGDIRVDASSAGSPREVAEALRDELARVFEGMRLEMGAA